MKLWVVGKWVDGDWELQGVFDTEDRAVAICEDAHYFVGPVTLNEELPDDRIVWPGAYYPIKI